MTTRRQKKIDDFYLRALGEMFRRVGFESYDKEFTQQPYWYTLREWTLEEDVDFTKWFTEEYRKTFRCAKYIAKGAAGMFVFNYGWKLKKEFDKLELFLYISTYLLLDGHYYNNLEMEFSMIQSLHTWQSSKTSAPKNNGTNSQLSRCVIYWQSAE